MERSVSTFFIECLAKSINANKSFESLVLTETQADKLLHLSKTQALSHIVAKILIEQNCIDKNSNSKPVSCFVKDMEMAIFKSVQTDYDLNLLTNLFEENQVLNIPLKGSVVKSYYPEMWMRTSCDIDVLIKPQDLDIAKKILVDNGFTFKGRTSHDIQFESPSGTFIEVHFDLVEDDSLPIVAKVLSKVWDNLIDIEDYKYQKNFNPEFFCFYHLAHMAKHFLTGGCGVRSVLDYYLIRQAISIDTAKYNDLLFKGCLVDFEREIYALSNFWFGENDAVNFASKLDEYIILGGVLGDVDNMVAVQNVKQGGKFKYLLSRIFLPYSRLAKQYPVLLKRKWLTPFYQVKRWISFVFNGGIKKSKKELNAGKKITENSLSDTQILLTKLGLK